MLEFNHEHKAADLSAIREKTEKSKMTGKVILCGIMLSSVLLLSGCGCNCEQNENETTNVVEPITSSTAIIMEHGNAMIVDLQSYEKYIEYEGSVHYSAHAEDKTWVLHTSTGDRLLVDYDSVEFIEGEDSHEKAEIIAQALIAENGRITCYDELLSYGKTR